MPVLQYNTRFVHTIRNYTLLDHMHAQLKSVRLYIAQQRSVAPCGAVRSRAVRCRALRCGAVSLRCVLSFENRAVSTGYNACCVRSTTFPLFSSTCHIVFDLSRPPVFLPHANYPRTADQNVRPVTKAHSTAEHNRGICSKQLLALSNRCSHQIMGLFFLPPSHVFSCILPCLARA